MKTDVGRSDLKPAAHSTRMETAGRLFFLLAGGVLLSVLVSCACGPVR
jgi:hypothetical protein